MTISRRHYVTLILFVLVSIAPSRVFSDDEIVKDIKRFISVVRSEKIASIEDYDYYFGTGAEEEIMILAEVCKKMEWTPYYENPQCVKYVNGRLNDKKALSAYIMWLNRVLPKIGDFSVISVKNGNGDFPHQVITISTGSGRDKVEFFMNLNTEQLREFGKLRVTKINSKPINELFLSDLEKSSAMHEIFECVWPSSK